MPSKSLDFFEFCFVSQIEKEQKITYPFQMPNKIVLGSMLGAQDESMLLYID